MDVVVLYPAALAVVGKPGPSWARELHIRCSVVNYYIGVRNAATTYKSPGEFKGAAPPCHTEPNVMPFKAAFNSV